MLYYHELASCISPLHDCARRRRLCFCSQPADPSCDSDVVGEGSSSCFSFHFMPGLQGQRTVLPVGWLAVHVRCPRHCIRFATSDDGRDLFCGLHYCRLLVQEPGDSTPSCDHDRIHAHHRLRRGLSLLLSPSATTLFLLLSLPSPLPSQNLASCMLNSAELVLRRATFYCAGGLGVPARRAELDGARLLPYNL